MALGRLLAGLALAATLAGPAAADGLDHALGKALFERLWVPAPASTDSADGLGPLFNARACSGCHAGGGPARFRADEDGGVTQRGLVLRLADTQGRPDPWRGLQRGHLLAALRR